MNATPCVGRADVYDIALYDDDNIRPADRAQAVHTAAALCNGCALAADCDGRVTLDAAPRDLVLLPDGWMPPEREGIQQPETPPARGWSAGRRQAAAMTVGRGYVKPAQRPTAWARMAAELAAEGRSVPKIADALCVSEDTVRRLLGASAVRPAA